MRFLKTLILLLSLGLFGCGSDELTSNIEVYSNNFENSSLTDITGGRIMDYLGNSVIGNYNNDGFQLRLNDLPKHEYIYISFDILIHDTWDGNSNGFEQDSPDLWIMELNSGLNTGASEHVYQTTFSNGPCDSALCLWQSFPNVYPFVATPKKGIIWSGPGLCAIANSGQGTSVYRIQKTYNHRDKALVIDFYDRLFQPNRVDGKCDESWSMDNLEVRALSTK